MLQNLFVLKNKFVIIMEPKAIKVQDKYAFGVTYITLLKNDCRIIGKGYGV